MDKGVKVITFALVINLLAVLCFSIGAYALNGSSQDKKANKEAKGAKGKDLCGNINYLPDKEFKKIFFRFEQRRYLEPVEYMEPVKYMITGDQNPEIFRPAMLAMIVCEGSNEGSNHDGSDPEDATLRARYSSLSISSDQPFYKSDSCLGCHRTGKPQDGPQIRGDHGNHPMGRKWADTSCAVSGCHSKDALPGSGLFRLDGYQSLADTDGEYIDPYWDAPALPFDQQRFDCISCHSNHGIGDNPAVTIESNPSYLLYADFKEDNTAFCERCHGGCKASMKRASLLAGSHYKTRNDPHNMITRTFKATETRPELTVKCGGCMFCHFIHLDQDDPRDVPKTAWADDNPGAYVRADINALMRVPPKALDWGNQGGRTSSISDPTARYEAMCYGCHGNPDIVGHYGENGENGENGSLLKPQGMGFFSHRFACVPSNANTSNTKANISMTPLKDGKFPVADGTPGAAGGVMDDYGTIAGQTYCGTCHDVHNNQKPPYLYKLSPRDVASPYLSDSIDVKVTSQDARDGFCEQCHCSTNNPDPMSQGTHPVGKTAVPDFTKTVNQFMMQFSGRDSLSNWGGGSPYGLTYLNRGSRGGVICLTCHNVHAASTSWDGMVNSGSTKNNHGKLLVMDNYSHDPGSNMCLGCHDTFELSVDGSPNYGGHLVSAFDVGEIRKQVCANCHIPHGAKGIKIWSHNDSPYGMDKKSRIKNLCVSCHYLPNNGFPKISSGLTYKEHGSTNQWSDAGKNARYNNVNGNVFPLTNGETDKSADHVMGETANCTSSSKTAEIPAELRHLNDDEGGFYCGSCHDPHKQPNGKTDGNGDYLRVMNGVNAGTTHDRRGFCRQCHPKNWTRVRIHNNGMTSDPQCEACHRPHDGYKYKSADDIAAKQRLILVDYLPATGPFEFPDTSFKASTDVAYKSSNCTSCHFDFKDPYGNITWADAPKLCKNRGHHPMGRPWKDTSCVLSGCHVNPPFINGKIAFELDGLDPTTQNPLPDSDKRKIFDCTSCHAAHTNEVPGNPSFLLYASFKDDDTAFCEYCHNCTASSSVELSMHTSKTKASLAANRGKHFKTRNKSPLKRKVYYTEGETAKSRGWNDEGCGGCMLCHFVHLNDQMDKRVIPETNNVNSIPTDIKALMRVPAKALDWGEQGYSLALEPKNRYEAMCYGCHSDPAIVGSYNGNNTENGSLLNPKIAGNTFYSHRFSCKPFSVNTMTNIGRGKSQFPKGDGKPGQIGDVHNDYGTVDGQIYCGTCHDVHDNMKPPYLYRLSATDFASPYKSDDYKAPFISQDRREGFCEQCHCTIANSDPDGKISQMTRTHPVGERVVPNPLKTLSPFTERFYGGGSGSDRGITYDQGNGNSGVICLTCHNVHAAKTPWNGIMGTNTPKVPAPDGLGRVPNLHGYLLVDDNYAGPPGGSMCQGCHNTTKYSVDGSPCYGGHLVSEFDVGEVRKQVCANCHIPHGAKGIKIWSRNDSPYGMDKKSRIKNLCLSCHHLPNDEFKKISSGLTYQGHGSTNQWDNAGKNVTYNNKNGNVFPLTNGETDKSADHVMGETANFTSSSKTAEIPAELCPLNDDEGGFYCGSCHNPHKQPKDASGKPDVSGNGDYLRVMNGVNAGTTHDRREFCRQCHPKNGTHVRIHNNGTSDPQCEACHRPHDGYKYTDKIDIAAKERLILVDYLPATEPFEFPDTSFKAPTGAAYKSTNCTSCHLDFTDPAGRHTWSDAPKLGKNRGHHPMGRPWKDTSCVWSGCHVNPPIINGKIAFELDGLDPTTQNPLPDSDKRKIFSCTSCHAAHTNEVPGNPSFLRYASFKYDDTAFCEYCHNSGAGSSIELPLHPSKTKASLAANRGKHFKTRNNSPLKRKVYYTEGETGKPRGWNDETCGGCMLCHFVHLNDQMDKRVIPETNNVNSIPTDIKALMRVPAKALDWGEQGYSLALEPKNRYEAMCYGCHSDPAIVGSYNENNTGNGSLLNPKIAGKTFYSHRFSCKPFTVNTMSNIGRGKSQFPKGDGKPGQIGDVHNDYGTVDGQIYCGTCHDVHDNMKPPYLYRLSAKDFASPYKSDDYKATFTSQAKRDGFCEQCHCTTVDPDPMGGVTHPIGKTVVPNPLKTLSPFTEKFYGGGSGSDRGITYNNGGNKDGVICLTCHNVHAAKTPWNGIMEANTPNKPDMYGRVPDLHGYLLVDDNYAKPPGGSMCQGCHSQFLSNERSGDINKDGQVTPADALAVFKCYIDIENCPDPNCADANKDGQITPADALCIFKRFLGSPCCLD